MIKLADDDTLAAAGAELVVGDWQVFPALNRIARQGRQVPLQNLSMQVLLYLSRRPGAVATYDELLDALWPGRCVAEDAVHRRVADLRRHLQDDARAPRYIETIPKRGYRLIAKVQRPKPPVWSRSYVAESALVVTLAALIVGLMIMGPWS